MQKGGQSFLVFILTFYQFDILIFLSLLYQSNHYAYKLVPIVPHWKTKKAI